MNGWLIGLILKIVGIWLLLFLILCGVSLFIRRIFGLKTDDIKPGFIDFWSGWAASIAFLQIWPEQKSH
jgi:hypothetical protein